MSGSVQIPIRRLVWRAFKCSLATLVLSGCSVHPEGEPLGWHSPVIDDLVKRYHTARNDIRAGDVDRALPSIDATYLGRLDKHARKLRVSRPEYLRRAVWDWPILSADRLRDVQTARGYIRLSFITDTLALSRDVRAQATTYVLFRHDNGWKVAGVTRVVKPLADPYGYGYPQHVHETDLPAYMRFPRRF